jgi:fructokinase
MSTDEDGFDAAMRKKIRREWEEDTAAPRVYSEAEKQRILAAIRGKRERIVSDAQLGPAESWKFSKALGVIGEQREFVAKKVVTFGELISEEITGVGRCLKGATFPFRVKHLGHHSHLVSRLGQDSRGAEVAGLLRQNGLSLDHIQWDDNHPTGTASIHLELGAPAIILDSNAAFDHIGFSPELIELASVADCICFGTLVQRSPLSRSTLHQMLGAAPQALKVLMLNLFKDCFSAEWITRSLDYADIVQLNESEAEHLQTMFGLPAEPESFARAVSEKWNIKYCLVTLGVNGGIAVSKEGETCRIAAKKGQLLDTIGLGDTLVAGFVHGILEGANLPEALAVAGSYETAVIQAGPESAFATWM